MTTHGKKYLTARAKVPAGKVIPLREAIETLKDASFARFDEAVDMAFRLGVNPKHADQMVRGTVVLPHGTGKSIKVLVLTTGERVEEAKAAGADFAGLEEFVEKIQGGWTDVDVIVATPDVMGQVGKLGKILGPKKLMPNPKSGTVTQNVRQAVKDLKAGRVEYRVDRAGNVHCVVGRKSFTIEQLYENVTTLCDSILRARPSSAKGQYIRSATISTTMGPGLRLDANEIGALVKAAG